MNRATYKKVIRKTIPSHRFWRITLCSFLYILMKFVLAFTYQTIIECLQDGQLKQIGKYVVFAIITVIISCLCFYRYFVFRKTAREECLYQLQQEQLDQLDRTSFSQFEQQPKGEYLTKWFNDCAVLADTYPNTVAFLILGVFQFTLAIVYGAINSIPFTLIILGASLMSCLMPAVFIKHIETTQKRKQAGDSSIRQFAASVLEQVPLIKSYRSETAMSDQFEKLYEEYADSTIENRKKEEKMNSVSVGVGYLANTLWIVAGMILIAQKQIDIGTFVGFISLSQEFSWPFNELSRLFAGLSRSKVSYERLYTFMPNNNTVSPAHKPQSPAALIELENASYGYKEHETLFDHLTMQIVKGEKAVITGASGSGKTTFLKMIAGLYEPTEGEIFYKEGLSVSYVPQQPSLFIGTIRENIQIGNEQAEEAEIEKAAERAGLSEWIESLPKGYDTPIDVLGKQNVSQGQMQRIAIARALLKKADLYLLDEITSALDPKTEEQIVDTICSLEGAVLFISHKENVIDRFERKIEI